MNEFHGHRAFSHAGGNAFRGAMTDIPGNKNPRHAGLEIERVAVRGPACRAPAIANQVLSGNQVPLRIALDHAGEPIGAGNGPRVYEEGVGGQGFL